MRNSVSSKAPSVTLGWKMQPSTISSSSAKTDSPVSDGGRAQGDGLDIALFGNGAAQISPVEQMQLAVHCRIGGIGFAAGNHKAPGEGAGSGSLFRQRLQKLDAQVIGL